MPKFNEHGQQYCSQHNNKEGAWLSPNDFPSGGGWCKLCRRLHQQAKKGGISPASQEEVTATRQPKRGYNSTDKPKHTKAADKDYVVSNVRTVTPVLEGKCKRCGRGIRNPHHLAEMCEQCLQQDWAYSNAERAEFIRVWRLQRDVQSTA